MKERPILFSAAMVRALLDGSKTQTRRVVKPQPIYGDVDGMFASWMFKKLRAPGHWLFPNAKSIVISECPYGVVGDRLWVRESFWGCDMPGHGDQPCVVYEDEWHGKEYHAAEVRPYARRFGHIPGIHMPRDASRITLEVTDVRVERLDDISESDARAEGVTIEERHKVGYCVGADRPPSIRAYRELWDSLNAARGFGWDVNPWVWVVEFKRVQS